MFGFLIGTLLGFYGGKALATTSSVAGAIVDANARRWTIKIGMQTYEVYRNGATWAWRRTSNAAEGQASGADVSATSAILRAIEYALANGASSVAGINVDRNDGQVKALVLSPAPGSQNWPWQIRDFRYPNNDKSGTTPARPSSTLDMLHALQPYTED